MGMNTAEWPEISLRDPRPLRIFNRYCQWSTYTTPCAIIASAMQVKPAMLAKSGKRTAPRGTLILAPKGWMNATLLFALDN
jgi:hypothetical protein